jgi:hypothetical protein
MSWEKFLLWLLLFFVGLIHLLFKQRGSQPIASQTRLINPVRLINLVIILKCCTHYVPAINQLTLQARFQDDLGRRDFLRKLSLLLAPTDIIDGFLRCSYGRSPYPYHLWQQQKHAAEIQDLVTNIAPPYQSPNHWDHRPAETAPIPNETTYCIIGIILESSIPEIQDLQIVESVRMTIPQLVDWLKSDGDFYYYFGPTTTGISLEEARRLLTKVRQRS